MFFDQKLYFFIQISERWTCTYLHHSNLDSGGQIYLKMTKIFSAYAKTTCWWNSSRLYHVLPGFSIQNAWCPYICFQCIGMDLLYPLIPKWAGFFSGGGTGGPPIRRNFCQSPPPHRHLSPFLDQGLSPPAEVCPRKFEKIKYIFVSNLTNFKLKSTLKSCISCLK